jgi:hypothetical protein
MLDNKMHGYKHKYLIGNLSETRENYLVDFSSSEGFTT